MSTPPKPRRPRRPKIVLSSTRLAELEALSEGMMRRNPELAEQLVEELGRARIVTPSRLRADVVDLGREVTYHDETTGKDHTVTLVLPQEADISSGRVSVMTPIGVALIGLAEDAVFHWETRDGQRRALKILKVSPLAQETLTCAMMVLPAVAQTSLNLTLGPADSVETINYSCDSGAALRVQYVNAGPNALALLEINGVTRIFVGVVSGSGARYVSGAEVWFTKGGIALLENQLADTMVRCSQSDDAQRE